MNAVQSELANAPVGVRHLEVSAHPDTALCRVYKSIDEVRSWVETHNYKGYEPFDGLSSWFRPLALGNLFAERLLMQAIRQSPINLRPFCGVRPLESTKGRGYMASGYLILYSLTGRETLLDKAVDCLRWLDVHKCRRFEHHSWSNHFDFASRAGRYTKDDPIIVWTVFIGHAFLDAYETTGDTWFLRIAESACNWIYELPREHTDQGACISYYAHTQSSIHNANMLGAGLLARAAKHTGNGDFAQVARSAMLYSCSRQLPDGSWLYAEDPKFHWIDNFHTGYNLDSLDIYSEATGDATWQSNLEKGLAYYKATFIEPSGRPKYYDHKVYPVDIQCAAQSIETFSRFADRDEESGRLAEKVAMWTIENMQDRRGYFYYRQYPWMTGRIPMLHWGQATMFKALAKLAARLQS